MFYFDFVTINGPFKHQRGVNASFEIFLTFLIYFITMIRPLKNAKVVYIHLGGLVKDKSKIKFEENFINFRNKEFNKN
jgi:hypothetical protein